MVRNRSVVVGALAAIVAIALAGSPSSEDVFEKGLLRYVIAPNTADPRITKFLAPHYVYLDTRAVRQGRLLLFLPGSGADPKRFRKLLVVAAGAGMHAIGLTYNNAPSLKRLCQGDPDCFASARREIVYGNGTRVDRAHSIESRLITLLRVLDRDHPDQGWGDFLEAELPRWGSIVLAGHSQGGSHVGLIAHDHVVDRALLFGNSPSWIDDAPSTPITSYYGFIHWGDHREERVEAFRHFGMWKEGDPVSVDGNEPPYRGSQFLCSKLPAEKPHSSIVADDLVPESPGGGAIYAPVWRYLLGAEENRGAGTGSGGMGSSSR